MSKQFDSRTLLKSRNILDNSITKTTISKTKKTSLYNFNFEQNLIDNYIYSSYYNFLDNRIFSKSSNWKNINKRLKKSRLSLFLSRFSDEIFNTFVRINSRVLNENAVIDNVFSVIQNTARILSAKNRLVVGSDFGSNFRNRSDSIVSTLGIDPKSESISIILEPIRFDSSRYSILTLGIESNCQEIENNVIISRYTKNSIK